MLSVDGAGGAWVAAGAGVAVDVAATVAAGVVTVSRAGASVVPAVDVAMAERLIADPALYAAALRSVGTAQTADASRGGSP